MIAVSLMGQTLIPQLKLSAEEFDLEEKLLSNISKIADNDKAELLVMLAPKLDTEKLKEAFSVLMSLENGLTKGAALIGFLPYLENTELESASQEIFNCIEVVLEKEHKLDLVDKFIKQLEENKNSNRMPNYFYIMEASQNIALLVKNSFSLSEQILLEGQAFKLMYWYDPYKHYSIYQVEKIRLVKSIKALHKPKEKYLALLSLLKTFPLEENEIAEIANLALESLSQDSNSQKKANENNDVGENDSISIENQIELLRFLPGGKAYDGVQQRYESFAVVVYKQIRKTKQSLIEQIIKLKLFLNAYRLESSYDNPNCGDAVLAHLSEMQRYELYNTELSSDKDRQQQCYKLSNLLANDEWHAKYSTPPCDSLYLIKHIQDPIMKLDALILLLEALKHNLDKPIPTIKEPLSSLYYKVRKITKEKAIKEAFNSLILVKDKGEKLLLSIRLLPYLRRSIKKQTASNLLSEIVLLSDEVTKAEILVELLPHLNSELRKEAFSLAQRINNQTDRAWILTSFAPYLPKPKKQKVLKQAIELLKQSSSRLEKTLLIKQLIKFGL